MAQSFPEPRSTDTAESLAGRISALARARRRLSLQSLHRHPPLTPAGVLLRFRFTVPLLVGAFVFLALAAAVSDAALLRVWDEPVQRAVENARTPWLDTLVKAISQLGGTTIAVIGLCVLLSVVLAQCRSLALVLFLASAARPLLEWTLKRLIDRPRPDLDRLVHGEGPSFPSGHPLAAMALWGLLPPVVALFTRKRVLWWWSVVVSVTVIVLVALSRVYLGVHWLSDIVAALVFGSLYLLAVEWLLDWHHERRTCRAFVAGGHDLDEDLVKALTRPPRPSRNHPGE